MVPPLFLLFLLLHGVAAQKIAETWRTLSGDPPAVVARGGFSGIFPDSTSVAYEFANAASLYNVALLCDLQVTKDGVGVCRTDIRLDNSTTIADAFPDGAKTYKVNGEPVHGWFSVDFTAEELFNINVSAIQNIYSRPNIFDGVSPILTLDDFRALPHQFWLNVQYDMFFKQHTQDIAVLVTELAEHRPVNYISSPEVGFLKRINAKVGKRKTKLIFRFLEEDAVEPTTKQTYGSFLEDLSSIKSFCSGILVPKSYIWPVGADQYLQSHTSLVQDAHKQGLEVYAYNFANDIPASYNYSYDPTAEYLQFIDNPDFSVDGVFSDFPSTASAAVACLAHNKNSTSLPQDKPLVITHNGASGVYAGCTDLAYEKAVQDGADIVDCSVQMTKDGIAFCLDSADLMSGTTAVTTFMSRSTMIPEIQPNSGIFSFDLTWSEIQSLKPELKSPIPEAGLPRNPAAKNQGKLMKLAEFLEFAQDKSVNGVLINIENAAYLASKKGLDVVGAVTTALADSGFANHTAQQVLIQSDDSAVLSKFKQVSSYKRVLSIKETISDALRPAVDEIKHMADAVNIPRSSLVSSSGGFLVSFSGVVDKMHAANISVYVSVLRNEYVAIAFDFYSDPMAELVTYIAQGVDGIVTEFPATATAYIRSPCYNGDMHDRYTIYAVEPGSLVGMAAPDAAPPAEAPAPALTAADVVDPPLPSVAHLEATAPVEAPASPSQPSGQSSNMMINAPFLMLMVVFSLMFMNFP